MYRGPNLEELIADKQRELGGGPYPHWMVQCTVRFAVIVFWITLILGIGIGYWIGNRPAERCRIVGDREYVTGNCIPYCPPHPSECG